MNILKLSIFIITAAVIHLGEANDACDSRFEMISSLTEDNCPADIVDDDDKILYKFYVFHDDRGEHECFPYCKEIKTGLATIYQFCSIALPCPPGYICTGPEFEAHCVLDLNSCFKYYVNYDDKEDASYYKAQWKPECLPGGTWAPKQCKGEKFTGRCFCFDKIGNRIDGHQWAIKAENMTCACSRKRAEMMSSKTNLFVSLHCDDEGNYEPLQCNDGLCWCADPPTGEVVSKIVAESMMKLLPCYEILKNGNQYMRQCESQYYAQKKIVAELSTHGTVGFQYDNILCDFDGTYGIYKISGKIASCVWKDNTPLGSQLDLNEGDISLMNCRCARDLKLYEMAGHDPETRGQCAGNGNYEPVQMKVLEDGGTKFYCVDSDGFQISPLLDKKPKNCEAYM